MSKSIHSFTHMHTYTCNIVQPVDSAKLFTAYVNIHDDYGDGGTVVDRTVVDP